MDELELYEEILRLMRSGSPAVLATVVESSGSAPRRAGAKMLLRADGTLFGSVGGGKVEAEAVAAGRLVLAEEAPRTVSLELTPEHGMVCGGRVTLYLEPLVAAPRLIVVGAGHVGQALARVARRAGFSATLVDPSVTEHENRVEGFSKPDLACPPEEIFESLAVDDRTFVVIAAPSHEADFRAVLAALATPARFIGLLGSRRKRETLFDFLREAGVPEENLDRVVTPVGLPIGSQTPEEIAISIVAQLIAIRRGASS